MARTLLPLVAILYLASTAIAQLNTPFVPGCTLPFEAIAVKRGIDLSCGRKGSAGSLGGQRQNEAKNEFCAPGPLIDVTIADLKAMQRKVEEIKFPFGEGQPPEDRGPLAKIYEKDGQKIGEGSLVRLTAYVDYPHFAGTESVNCRFKANRETGRFADLHVELVERIGDRRRARVR